MKTLFAALTFLTCSSWAVQAQKALTQGTVTYEMKMEGNPMAAMMGTITMDIAFKDSRSNTSMNLMNGLVDMRIVFDNKENERNGLMLMSMMGKKMAVRMQGEAFEQYEAQQRKNQEPPKITYYKNEKKKIAGYPCYKAVAEVPNAGEVTLYICEKIRPAATSQFQMQFPGLEGYPLGIEMSQMGMLVSFTANKINKAAPKDDLFIMDIPEGYEEMSLEELQQQGGGGGLFGM